MVTLTLLDGQKKSFNLKSFDREKALYSAWYSMKGDPQYDDKIFKIGTGKEVIVTKINDIANCEFKESEYVEAEVKERQSTNDLFKKIKTAQNSIEKQNIEKFVNILKSKGMKLDYNDPFLLKVIDSVRKERYASKIPLYANLYFNKRKK